MIDEMGSTKLKKFLGHFLMSFIPVQNRADLLVLK